MTIRTGTGTGTANANGTKPATGAGAGAAEGVAAGAAAGAGAPAAPGVAAGAVLRRDALHGSLGSPAMGSINFLNEVMGRFPDAISFAPGAPHTSFFAEIDTARHTARYLRHLEEERGLGREQAERLLYQYGPSRGLINGLVADALRTDQGIDVPPESLVITVGCQEAMLLALRALVASPADLVAVVNPCFVGLSGAASVLGVDLVPVDDTEEDTGGTGGTEGGIDFAQLDEVCRAARRAGRRIRALYAAPDFSNPSGGFMSLEARHRLLAVAEREDFLVLEDNAYAFTAEQPGALPPLKALPGGERVVHLGTFAKVCMPGARVGYVVADQPVRDASGRTGLLADELATLKSMVTVNTSPLSQAVIGGILLEHGGSLASVVRAKAELYQRNLRLLLDALDRGLGPGTGAPAGVSWNRPRGGFFVRVRLPVAADERLLERSAREFGVLWTPMSHFYLGDGGDRELRLACSYLDPDTIEEGVVRLTRFLHAVCP
ncbi:PLP-dependent aminotransferase family protein [Streptomyces sp. NPDC056909]|uniref:aminotransferase-like domain-containing protein n=1 Tax=Streptomyces sp. NPDC056909 TaxID=3345963 RepID=UPI0036B6A3CF